MSALAGSLFSCNLSSHGPTSASSDTIAFSGASEGCVNTALPNLQNYFNAQNSDADVAQTWECFNGAVQTFEKYVRSADNSTDYSATEFRAFIEKYFMGDLKISDQLLSEVMLLKQVLIGGSTDRITHSDLLQVEAFLTVIEKEARAVNPHMKVIVNVMNTTAVTVNEVDVNYAESQLIESLTNIAKALPGTTSAYKVSDFQSLLTELSSLYDQLGHHWDGPSYIVGKLPAFINAKAFFFKPSGDTVNPDEWVDLFSTAAQIYGIWMRVSYVLNPTDYLTTGYGLAQLILTMHKSFDLLQTAMARKANGQIDFDVLNNLIGTVFDLGLIDNPKLVKNTILNLAAPIFFKVYSPATNGVRFVPSGIDKRIFAMMLDDFDGWAEMQQLYDTAVLNLPSPQSAPSLTQLKTLWGALTPVHVLPYQEVSDIFNRTFAQQFNDNGTLIFEKNISDRPLNQEAFTGINWRRLFVSALVRGYTEDPSYHFAGVTAAQFNQFYNDVVNLGIDLRFLDPRTQNIDQSLFLYAHLFYFSADTSSRLSFEQGMDVISYSMSAAQMSNRTYAAIASVCPKLDQLDVYKLPMINVNCYRAYFRKNFASYFPEMSHWVKAANSWTDAQWQDFMVSLETLARVHGNSDQPMESADLDKISNVFGYIESMYVRYDADNSDTINLNESMNFYPLLKPSIAQQSQVTNDTINTAIFTYIMKTGAKPAITTEGIAELLLWELEKGSWAYELDRIQWVKILNALSSVDPTSLTQTSSAVKKSSLVSRNPAMSTMTIALPTVGDFIQQVFTTLENTPDWNTVITDPNDQQKLQDFKNLIAK